MTPPKKRPLRGKPKAESNVKAIAEPPEAEATNAPASRGWQLPARVGPELRAAIEEYARRERRKSAQAIVLLIESALEKEGLWPPPGSQ